jgi:hypothetical protein
LVSDEGPPVAVLKLPASGFFNYAAAQQRRAADAPISGSLKIKFCARR